MDKVFKEIYGWDNHETHQVVLYLQNDLYFVAEELREQSKEWAEFSDKIKDLFNELRDQATGGDIEVIKIVLAVGSYGRVNWDQIGKSLFKSE